MVIGRSPLTALRLIHLINMVNLEFTDALSDKIATLSLPVELQSLVASHTDTQEQDDPRRSQDRTIPHEVLVRISDWTKHDPDRGTELDAMYDFGFDAQSRLVPQNLSPWHLFCVSRTYMHLLYLREKR